MFTVAQRPSGRPSVGQNRRHPGGFTLLEVVLVLFVLGALAAVLAPSARDIIERSRREAEGRALEELAGTITASFENTDLSNLNVGGFARNDCGGGFGARCFPRRPPDSTRPPITRPGLPRSRACAA
jgi:prepilin-type N-terminal cleavage/methylation domain-containing protein